MRGNNGGAGEITTSAVPVVSTVLSCKFEQALIRSQNEHEDQRNSMSFLKLTKAQN